MHSLKLLGLEHPHSIRRSDFHYKIAVKDRNLTNPCRLRDYKRKPSRLCCICHLSMSPGRCLDKLPINRHHFVERWYNQWGPPLRIWFATHMCYNFLSTQYNSLHQVVNWCIEPYLLLSIGVILQFSLARSWWDLLQIPSCKFDRFANDCKIRIHFSQTLNYKNKSICRVFGIRSLLCRLSNWIHVFGDIRRSLHILCIVRTGVCYQKHSNCKQFSYCSETQLARKINEDLFDSLSVSRFRRYTYCLFQL